LFVISKYGLTVYGMWKTLEISAPTVLEAAVGRVTPEVCDARLSGWANSLINRAEVRLETHGLENLPRDRAFIVMSNHQSHFDIPILYCVWPTRLRMVAKIELFKVPIWGRAMRAAGFVPVDRSGSREQSQAALDQAARAMAGGTSIWIAPEGTRSPDGNLGKFKKGGFRLAIDTHTPIVPVALDGSFDIIRKKTRVIHRGARVQVTVGPPIPPVAPERIDELVESVRHWIAKRIPERKET
jgi:1-acyl-sn-glycerol-3-phosphate acyltransferase